MIKILSIDDSKAVHGFLKTCLNVPGVELGHVYDGTEVVKLIDEGKAAYDLYLLDWEMPGMTGPQVVEVMKQKGISIPVIMLTSKNNPENIVEMLEKGVLEYIMKPFTKEILIEKIETVLGKKIVN